MTSPPIPHNAAPGVADTGHNFAGITLAERNLKAGQPQPHGTAQIARRLPATWTGVPTAVAAAGGAICADLAAPAASRAAAGTPCACRYGCCAAARRSAAAFTAATPVLLTSRPGASCLDCGELAVSGPHERDCRVYALIPADEHVPVGVQAVIGDVEPGNRSVGWAEYVNV
jgi:hypothetical protein